jgi:hypothetical protein
MSFSKVSWVRGSLHQKIFCEEAPSPALPCCGSELPSPARGEGTIGNAALAVSYNYPCEINFRTMYTSNPSIPPSWP